MGRVIALLFGLAFLMPVVPLIRSRGVEDLRVCFGCLVVAALWLIIWVLLWIKTELEEANATLHMIYQKSPTPFVIDRQKGELKV
jgi:hypothetical protein